MPVLVNKYNEGAEKVKWYVIRFRKNKRKTAYNKIGDGKDMGIYKWERMEIDGELVNVVVSANPEILENITNDPNMPNSLRNGYN